LPYPCFDSPNEKFTSEVTCRVPEGMTVISNGRLVSEEKDSVTGMMAVHWSQDEPHANYLVTLVAGYFKKLDDKHNNTPLAFFTPPSEFNEASNSFRDTKDVMEFFEQETGVPFPWVKYYQVCVNDFVAGGMENTSATTLTDGTLFTAVTENIRTSEGLVSHEMAHQWFGDLVTCKDWSHIWLNEGFATFYESLYHGHKNGRDAMLYEFYGRTRLITGMSNDVNAIVRRTYDSPGEMFGYLAYPKGSWVLRMLRAQLGDDLYRRCIKTYLERHHHANVTTEDLRAVIEELSGNSYDQFFDQWLYHAHHPELDVKFSWDEKTKLAKVSIQQTQKLTDNVVLFNFPLTVRFKGKFGTVDRSIRVKEKEEDFYFPLESAPEIVRLDPDYTLLAKINFDVPSAMLYAELADQTDVIGRLLAVDQLGNKKNKEAVEKLRQAVNSDSFYGVRVEAARALRTVHSEEALTALLNSTNQADARVRQQVYTAISDFYDTRSRESEQTMLAREKNPDIQTIAIRDLGTYPKADRETLLQYLNLSSYRNGLAEAAIGAIRAQSDPSWIEPLQQSLKQREADYTSRGFARGLNTLAYITRDEKDKSAICEFLFGYVNHKKRIVQLGAIEALGTLGDPHALAALGKFALARRESQEQRAATRAIQNIENFRRPVEGISELRKEFLDLQKENRELRKDFNALEKKLNAVGTKPDTTKKGSPILKSPRQKSAG
jgi:aminopeptidase N